jgi:hypothetical protein
MVKKKIIVVLGKSTDVNSKQLDFIHGHFKDCLIDAVYTEFPEKRLEKRLGDHFKTMVSQTSNYYNSTNKYRLLFQEPLNNLDLSSWFQFYDLLIVIDQNYDSLYSYLKKAPHSSVKSLPVLVLPSGQKRMVKNIVFVSTHPENTILPFKKFCYLFPSLCKNSDSILMHIANKNDEQKSENEKLLYEYLKTKCAHLSIHKVHDELHDADRMAMNLSDSSLYVLDKADTDLNLWLGTQKTKGRNYISFTMSA